MSEPFEQSIHRIYGEEIDHWRTRLMQTQDHLDAANKRIDDLQREVVSLHELLADARIHEKDVRGSLEEIIGGLEAQNRVLTLHLPSNVLREIAEGK